MLERNNFIYYFYLADNVIEAFFWAPILVELCVCVCLWAMPHGRKIQFETHRERNIHQNKTRIINAIYTEILNKIWKKHRLNHKTRGAFFRCWKMYFQQFIDIYDRVIKKNLFLLEFYIFEMKQVLQPRANALSKRWASDISIEKESWMEVCLWEREMKKVPVMRCDNSSRTPHVYI